MACLPCHMWRVSFKQEKWLLIVLAYSCFPRLVPQDRLVLGALSAMSPFFLKAASQIFSSLWMSAVNHGWLQVGMHHDSSDDCDILNAFCLSSHCHSMLINVHVLASGQHFSEDVPVCAIETVLQGFCSTLQPSSDLFWNSFFNLFSSGLYAGVSITVTWSERPRWGVALYVDPMFV